MRLIHSLADFPENLHGACLAMGNFDGVHAGHRAVIELACKKAHQKQVQTGVLLFDPPPIQFFAPDRPSNRIMSTLDRAKIMTRLGVDFVLAIPFDASVASMSDLEFSQNVLKETLKVCAAVVGYDFCFGRQRMGNVRSLTQHGEQLGFDVIIAPQVDEGEVKASSTLIRNYIREGDVERAAQLLQTPWTVHGGVEHGEKRGRTIGFPTANMTLHDFVHPLHGIYAVWARIDGEDEWRPAVANFGRTPTTGLRDPLLEVFIFDWQGDLYGRKLHVAFGKFLRPEAMFDDLEELIAQMKRDEAQARSWLETAAAPE